MTSCLRPVEMSRACLIPQSIPASSVQLIDWTLALTNDPKECNRSDETKHT